MVQADVRVTSGSVIIEHPGHSFPVEALVSIVSRLIKTGRELSEPLAELRKKRRVRSVVMVERKYHVSGMTLILSGLYLLYLSVRRVMGVVALPTTMVARLTALPTIATLWLSLPIQRQAVTNLKRTGKPDMGLMSVGLLYLAMLTGTVLAAFSVFWLFNLSSWMESRIRTRTRRAVREMLSGNVKTAWLIQGDVEIEVDVESLRPGDMIGLRIGSTVPVDGTVITGSALVDESTISGESMPVSKGVDDAVLAGTVISDGRLRVRVDRAGEETRLAAIIRLIENAEKDPGQLQRMSEHFSRSMVPVSLGLAATAFVLTGNLLQAMAVLMITCPCALRLSTSVAVSVAMSSGAKKGILVKGGRYIETAGQVTVLVLDKTGTLTHTSSEIVGIDLYDRRFRERTLLQLAASVQGQWQHPLSRAIRKKAEQENIPLRSCEDKELIVGKGVWGRVDGKKILVGSRAFLESQQVSFKTLFAAGEQGLGSLYIARERQLLGLLRVRSVIRDDVEGAVKRIRSLGIDRIVLLTGDQKAGVEGMKELFGFDELHWELSPEDKAEWIRCRREENPDDVIAMVGDGINDTPAFAMADLSMAIGDGGADVTVEFADIVLQRGGIDRVVETLILGRESLRTIKESYALAIGANGVILALTVTGVLMPVAGALFHNMTTVAAVTHAASLRKRVEE